MIFFTQGELDQLSETAEETFDNVRANTDCTLYNKYINGGEFYQRTVIRSVSWLDVKAINKTASGGNLAANKAEVIIPFSRDGYLKPVQWLALVDKSANWTLQEGDLLVKGEAVESIAPGFTVTDLRKLYEVFEVTIIDTMDKSLAFKHWKVGAK